jgi:hypothetical protein
MHVATTNTKKAVKQINWLVFRIVICCCSKFEERERVLEEYNQVYE